MKSAIVVVVILLSLSVILFNVGIIFDLVKEL